MLSGETAIGQFPVEAVKMMALIIERTEGSPLCAAHVPPPEGPVAISDAVARAAVALSAELGARLIAVYTESGYTARLVSKQRPARLILGLSRHTEVCQRMALLWGVRPRLVADIGDVDHLAITAESIAASEHLAERGDWICLVAGTPFAVPGKTDMIKLHRVGAAG